MTKHETPGNMLRELYARTTAAMDPDPRDGFDKGWNAALRLMSKDIESVTSKVEGWEIRQERDQGLVIEDEEDPNDECSPACFDDCDGGDEDGHVPSCAYDPSLYERN